MKTKGEGEYGIDRYVGESCWPVETQIRLALLARHEFDGHLLIALFPGHDDFVAPCGIEGEVLAIGDNRLGLDDFVLDAVWRGDGFHLHDEASVVDVRPAEVVRARLQLLQRLYADAKFVAGRELVVFTDRSCEFGVNAEPVVERDGLAVQSKVLDAFNESVERTLHVLELATDESVVQRELHHLVKVVRLTLRDLGAFARSARLGVVAVDDTVFELRLNICHGLFPLFMLLLLFVQPSRTGRSCSVSTRVTCSTRLKYRFMHHWTIAEDMKCVHRRNYFLIYSFCVILSESIFDLLDFFEKLAKPTSTDCQMVKKPSRLKREEHAKPQRRLGTRGAQPLSKTLCRG